MKKLSKSQKVKFYLARQRRGDLTTTAGKTNYSISHISNGLAGRRTLPNNVVDTLYSISKNRTTNRRTLTTA